MAEYPALENNEFIVKAAEVAANMAAEEAYLGALVSRALENDLLGGGGKGRSVDIRVPAALVARTRGLDATDAIVLDALRETTKSVSLGEHLYSAVGLTEGEMALDVEDFSRQVLQPQVAAVVDAIEDEVAKALKAIPATEIEWDEETPLPTFTEMRKVLRKRNVPQTGLNVVVGTDVYAALLNAEVITDAAASGSTAALREGNVGKLRGFTIVESTRVGAGEIIAFHKDAFALAVKAPSVPAGQSGSIAAKNGYALRTLRDYDTLHTVHRSMVSTFAGVVDMPMFEITRDRSTGTAEVVEHQYHAALRVNTGGEEADEDE